jgi:DNA-binding transcriptional LysR family regulator
MKAPSLDRIRALEVLLRTRNLSSAALELGVARSAAASTLRQLRSYLNDQLLIRRGRHMIRTPRGEHLADPLGATLHALDTLLEGDGRRAYRTTATIAMRDQFALSLAPALIRQVAAESPRTTLKIVPYERDRLADYLGRGTVDVAVAVDPPDIPDLVTTLLYRETFVCVTSEREPVTLERYLSASHVATASQGHDVVDAALARLGYRRRVVAHVPHFAALLRAAESEGLYATVPLRAIKAMRPANVFVHLPPLAIPDFCVSLVWDRRYDHDPRNRWLRGLLMSAAEA